MTAPWPARVLVVGATGLLGRKVVRTHPIGIEISMRAGKPVFGFHDCGRLWKSQVKPEEVEVYEVGEGGRMTLVCSAKLTGVSEWTYGHMAQHCPPLEADKIYEVAADKPGSMGIRRFRLSSAGGLQPLMPAC